MTRATICLVMLVPVLNAILPAIVGVTMPVVKTLVLASRVVPDSVGPGIVVFQGGQLPQPVIVAMSVIESPVLGTSVVAGKTVVPVDKLAVVPSPVAGMALPTPLLVHGLGKDRVAVSGFIELIRPPL